MATKAKTEAKVPILKGQEAEDKILEYMKRMNRPYGAVDVAANLKGVVPKAATQKILVTLAEKGALVQKTYGKTTFFVSNQANIEAVPVEKFAALEEEYKAIDEANKLTAAELRASNAVLAKLKNTPTNLELNDQIAAAEARVASLTARLEPLRSDSPLISAEELDRMDADWVKWRAEWVKRRKVFITFWQTATDILSPQEATTLADDLGIELDTDEHLNLEKTALCQVPKSANPLKRKR
ncbi:TBPIP-domain-containing protein [Collybia nuda]|uniref:TBPIP-domain-containing protein n=1 Tax=Collybia nuda TaxID=64659 RepID=A0A9P6CHK6_9AGAR|nr:TBPIP-domain-containing protein [Collybia nuda]